MMDKLQKICFVGLEYRGLPTAPLLTTKGFNVTGVDVFQKLVDTINRGGIHIVEPDLDIAVKSAVSSGNLCAEQESVEADLFIIALHTPFEEGRKPALFYVDAVTQKIKPFLKKTISSYSGCCR